MRPNSAASVRDFLLFQFTHPGKGATGLVEACRRDALFQFTHPGKGATYTPTREEVTCSCFNSRTLGRVRPCSLRRFLKLIRFQFTHPGKGATLSEKGVHFTSIVSIHAPWEGCDPNGAYQ